MINNKKLYKIFIVFVVFIVGVGAWWMSGNKFKQSQMSIADKTVKLSSQVYKNEKFSFKYPSDWISQEIKYGLILTIPNTNNKIKLDNLGATSVYWSAEKSDSLLREKKDELLKPWREELGITKEVPERKITKENILITVLGPFSPPSGMSEEIYVVVSDGKNQAIISSTIFGGNIDAISNQIGGVYNSIIFY